MSRDFDFLKYVSRQKAPQSGREEKTGFGDYAFSGDLRVLRKLDSARAVRVSVEATVRFWKAVRKNELLGRSVKVSARQFPQLHELVAQCAKTLDIPMPTVYVAQNLASLNAGTYGTDDESFIVINSALVDRFDEAELKFVIGHECGHIQNNHVVYHTAAQFLTQGVVSFVKWAVVPASVALNAWSRRGEITCDRAGLVCCRDEQVALKAIMKIALGSEKLFEEIDLEEYLSQLDGIKEGMGRFQEYFDAHPYLPKRVHALKLFTGSSYYRHMLGLPGGVALDEVDRAVEKVIQVY
ncbi:MAG: M48 family metallopeptidase [Bradymonadaceae bacterium]|nr:M48 family metallopeptidase [Lujinxingiaceae bacterium]